MQAEINEIVMRYGRNMLRFGMDVGESPESPIDEIMKIIKSKVKPTYTLVLNDIENERDVSKQRVIQYASHRIEANPIESYRWISFERAKFYIEEMVGGNFDEWNSTKAERTSEENYTQFFNILLTGAFPPFIYELMENMSKEVIASMDLDTAIKVIDSFGESVVEDECEKDIK